MPNTEETSAGNGRLSRCSGIGDIERTSSHASPYVIVVTTALVSLLVAILGWMLLEIRDVREHRELTAVAVERQRTAEARAKDLENQIRALRREQDLQNRLLRQASDWASLRMIK